MSGIWGLIAAVAAFAVTAVLGKWLVPYLHKINFGQTIRDEGPKWHRKKNGTPTMGGFMFIAGIAISLAACVPLYFYSTGKSPLDMMMGTKTVSYTHLAGLTKDITFIGASSRAEIWDSGRWNEFNSALTEDSIAEAMDLLEL